MCVCVLCVVCVQYSASAKNRREKREEGKRRMENFKGLLKTSGTKI